MFLRKYFTKRKSTCTNRVEGGIPSVSRRMTQISGEIFAKGSNNFDDPSMFACGSQLADDNKTLFGKPDYFDVSETHYTSTKKSGDSANKKLEKQIKSLRIQLAEKKVERAVLRSIIKSLLRDVRRTRLELRDSQKLHLSLSTEYCEYSAKLAELLVLSKQHDNRGSWFPGVDQTSETNKGLPKDSVLLMLARLNGDFFDASCGLVLQIEGDLFKVPSIERSKEEDGAYSKKLEDIVGNIAISDICQAEKGSDSFAVQIAIQAIIAYSVFDFITQWPGPSFWAGGMSKTYSSLCKRESKSVALRWRALATHNYRHEFALNCELFKRRTAEDMYTRTVQILQLAGYRRDLDGANPAFAEFSRCLTKIVDEASVFAEKLVEQVGVIEYRAFLVKPTSIFDSSRMALDEDRPNRIKGSFKEEKIACTTDLGIECWTAFSKNGAPVRGKRDGEVLQKALVVFEHEFSV